MEIKLHDGKSEIALRGNDGTFELCWPQNIKNKATGRVEEVFVAQRWYVSLPQVFDALLKLKISHADVTTLEGLQVEIAKLRKELIAIFE